MFFLLQAHAGHAGHNGEPSALWIAALAVAGWTLYQAIRLLGGGK